MNIYAVAAVWIAMAFAASVISIRLGVAVALVEIVIGAVVGNVPALAHHVQQTQYTDFLAALGSMILTFLAGAEIDPDSLRRHLKASLAIGFLSFLLPFLGAFAVCYLVLGWTLRAAEIGGVALSTTSVAVVYAVMVETGLNREPLGKLILAACFVTDLGTVLALGGLFANLSLTLVAFVVVSAVVLWFLPSLLRLIVWRVGHRVSEPEIKFLLLVLSASAASPCRPGAKLCSPRTSPGWWWRASSPETV